MEQFRRIGEVLGSLKALMVLQDDIQFNQHQCCLLHDMFILAFETIAEEIRNNLKLEEKNTKWKGLEQPLRELHRVFKEGELYIRHCMDSSKDWWGKLVILHQNNDCLELHVHNLLCYFPAVIEAIETAGEIAGLDQDEMQKKRVVLARKYDIEWNDPKLFHWRFGKQYLVPREISRRLENAWREDRWQLIDTLKEKKNEQKLGDLMFKKLSRSEPLINGKLFPSSILTGSKDYSVRRRLGGGSQYKEIQWLGESFAVRHFFGEIEPMNSEISTLLSLSHPNILQYLCGFYDEDKKECFLVMDLMNKDLNCYIRENCGPRRMILFSLTVVVDIMLQIARGMEYLHSKKIYHGDLNPNNILIKPKNSTEGYFHIKISGFGLSSVKTTSVRSSQSQTETNPLIWYAPEVLAKQEEVPPGSDNKQTEKADVYSFGMVCFELLTGKIPFEEGHLQGEKMSYNIRSGERPLFPHPSPKYLVNLTKKCWQTDPSQRPTFSSICRILRYIKKFITMNPEYSQPELHIPSLDYCDIEAAFLKKFKDELASSVSQIPFQMFAYRLAEKEKTSTSKDSKGWESASDAISISKDDDVSICRDDTVSVAEELFVPASDMRSICSDRRSVCSEAPMKKSLTLKKGSDLRTRRGSETSKQPLVSNDKTIVRRIKRSGMVEPKTPRSSQLSTRGQNTKLDRENPLPLFRSPLSQGRRRLFGHVSDSDLH